MMHSASPSNGKLSVEAAVTILAYYLAGEDIPDRERARNVFDSIEGELGFEGVLMLVKLARDYGARTVNQAHHRLAFLVDQLAHLEWEQYCLACAESAQKPSQKRAASLIANKINSWGLKFKKGSGYSIASKAISNLVEQCHTEKLNELHDSDGCDSKDVTVAYGKAYAAYTRELRTQLSLAHNNDAGG